MQDPLNAVRRLYGEPGAEDRPAQLPPEAEAEASALAELKAGLDALPPQRPDAAVLDAVFAAAAEDVLAPIRTVYEDEESSLDTPEAAVLAELKAGLDALPPQRPDASALAAVFAAAAGSSAAGSTDDARPAHAADRAPRRLITRRRVVVALSAAFALMLVLTSGLWLGPQNDLPTMVSTEKQAADEPLAERLDEEALEADADALDAEEALADAALPSDPAPVADAARNASRAAVGEAVASATPPVARQAAPPSVAPSAVSRNVPSDAALPQADLAAAISAPEAERDAAFAAGNLVGQGVGDLALASDELPLADGDEALQTLYLRMREMQAAQVGLGWDEPPDALGAAPDSAPPTTGWMQVRVER